MFGFMKRPGNEQSKEANKCQEEMERVLRERDRGEDRDRVEGRERDRGAWAVPWQGAPSVSAYVRTAGAVNRINLGNPARRSFARTVARP